MEIRLPELGTGETVRVSCWLVEPGDPVDQGDRVVEVLVPGMTFDVPAPVDGVLTRIDKPPDTAVVSGDVLGWIEPVADE